MLSQIDALLESLSCEEKEQLKMKCYDGCNRPCKPFMNNKDRAKRQTRSKAWMFLSEYYGIIFNAPIFNHQLSSFATAPLIAQSKQVETLHKRKRGMTFPPNDQPFSKRFLLTDEGSSASLKVTVPHMEGKSNVSSTASGVSLCNQSRSSSCNDDIQSSDEVESLPIAKKVLAAPAGCIHQEPCLLIGLFEMFEHRRDLFDKLCTELKV